MNTQTETTKKILVAAREILSDKARWTKGYYGRTANGDKVDDSDPGAVCFCSMGAVFKAARRMECSNDANSALEILNTVLPKAYKQKGIALYNDALNTKHHNVLKFFDRAIAKLES